MTVETDSLDLEPADVIVLNALVDLHDDDSIVLDETSESILSDVADDVGAREDVSPVADALARMSGLSGEDSVEIDRDVYTYVAAVTAELADRGASLSVEHEIGDALEPMDVHVYSFLQTSDSTHLDPLSLRPSIRDDIVRGAELLERDELEKGTNVLRQAVDASERRTESVTSRLVAGWGAMLVGDDEDALELVKGVLDVEDDSWLATLIGNTVTSDEAEDVRSGKKSVGWILRWHVTTPENTSVRVDLGNGSGDSGVKWSAVDGDDGHAFLNEIFPEMHLKFRLQGVPPDFPQLHTYFTGLGTFNEKSGRIETVFTRFGSGPAYTGSTERIEIRTES